jgi:hypothetical protein
MAVAAEYYEARLVHRAAPLWRRIASFTVRLVAALLGGAEMATDVDLVIVRRGTSIEVHRTHADTGDAELLLNEVRKDLDRLSVEEFKAEWSLP